MVQPTMEDVASRAGVSRALVSLVMRNSPKVSERSRTAVLAAAEELGYRRNLMAHHLASRRTMTIGLVLNDLHNPFFAEMTDGIHEAALEAGYRIVINTGLRNREGEKAAVDTFLEFRTDGIILVGSQLFGDELEALAAETNLVVAARDTTAGNYDTVSIDDHLGAQMVVDHLASLGHRRIAHIDGGSGAGARRRREGYQAAMQRHGLAEHVRIVAGEYSEHSGTVGVDRLLGDGESPTAIFAANDLMATGVLNRLQRRGLRVPGDVSLVGFDNTATAALHQMSLTTVDQPRELLGRLAAQYLIERLDEERAEAVHELLTPSLVCRSTSGPVTHPISAEPGPAENRSTENSAPGNRSKGSRVS